METIERKALDIPALERLEPIHTKGLQRVFGALRFAAGWTFLWAFLDKAFALGFTTGRLENGTIDFFAKDAAWLNGGSPTAGVVGFAIDGSPFKGAIQSVTGFQMTELGPQVAGWVDWIYMLSMVLIGLGLILGIGTRLAAVGGIAWMAIFYGATAIWPEHNPFMDEHVIYAIVLAGVAYVGAGRFLGLGRWWERTALVQRAPFLK
jgi:thiosulfate dehydrogenase [quinone] large subunit